MTDTIAKIDHLSKLVTRVAATLKDLHMAKSLIDNVGEQGTKGVFQVMSEFDHCNHVKRSLQQGFFTKPS